MKRNVNLKKLFIIIILIFSGFFYYNLTAEKHEMKEMHVIRVLDGDTIELENGAKARLKGINAPEKNMLYSEQAGEFLRESVENRNVSLEINGLDKYGRLLVYAFLGDRFLNKEILEKGFGSLYYYEKDSYFNKLKKAEKSAREKEIGIWNKSSNSECVKLISLKFKEKTECNNEEQLILENTCNKISVTMKDDATHIYKESLRKGIFTKNFSCIWNNGGDSLFIFDKKGLVLFYRY